MACQSQASLHHPTIWSQCLCSVLLVIGITSWWPLVPAWILISIRYFTLHMSEDTTALPAWQAFISSQLPQFRFTSCQTLNLRAHLVCCPLPHVNHTESLSKLHWLYFQHTLKLVSLLSPVVGHKCQLWLLSSLDLISTAGPQWFRCFQCLIPS